MAKDHKRLGDLLLEGNVITAEGLAAAVAEQRRTGQLLGATLIRLGLITESDLLERLQQQLGLPLVDLNSVVVDDAAMQHIKEELARKYGALPLEIEGRSTLRVAMADPLNVAALEDLRFHSGMFIKPVLAAPSQIQEAIERYYNIDSSMNEVIQNIITNGSDLDVAAVQDEAQNEAIDELMREAEGRPIVRLTNWLLNHAVENRASDIHIEPQERDLAVRVRIDGLLQEVQRLPKWTQSAIVSRIKVLSNLDIAEKRQPQDGRLVVEIKGRRIDMRVSTLPVTNGEKVVIRVVDQARAQVALADLGMQADDLTRIKRWLDRPQGIILVTGPTGSGKTTLLYSGLRHIQHITKNIVTVEDPVEFQIAGINQVQVEEKAKKTFPSALRAILRQDPDVVMVGEIRDSETAEIAIRAALTGHQVFSTLHTNDSTGAVTRLLDMGVEAFLISSSLEGVLAQRLVRRLCPDCRIESPVPPTVREKMEALGGRPLAGPFYTGKGCDECRDTGYRGRIGIFELLAVTPELRELILQKRSSAELKNAAQKTMMTMHQDAVQKAADGITSLEEILRVSSGDLLE